MALTRKMLKAMGIEEEKIEQIIDAHTETTDALKEENKSLKEKAENYDTVKKELDELKANPGEDWKKKHDAVKKEYDDYKAEQTKNETLKTKKSVLKALAENIGIKDPAILELILLKADYDKLELDGENLKDSETLANAFKTDYAAYVETDGKSGANVNHPPKGNEDVDLGTLDMASYIEARSKK